MLFGFDFNTIDSTLTCIAGCDRVKACIYRSYSYCKARPLITERKNKSYDIFTLTLPISNSLVTLVSDHTTFFALHN